MFRGVRITLHRWQNEAGILHKGVMKPFGLFDLLERADPFCIVEREHLCGTRDPRGTVQCNLHEQGH
jgi:hypothetical protein